MMMSFHVSQSMRGLKSHGDGWAGPSVSPLPLFRCPTDYNHRQLQTTMCAGTHPPPPTISNSGNSLTLEHGRPTKAAQCSNTLWGHGGLKGMNAYGQMPLFLRQTALRCIPQLLRKPFPEEQQLLRRWPNPEPTCSCLHTLSLISLLNSHSLCGVL